MSDNFNTNFDPYQHLMDLTRLCQELTIQHNNLAQHHEKLVHEVRALNEEIKRLRLHLRQFGSSLMAPPQRPSRG